MSPLLDPNHQPSPNEVQREVMMALERALGQAKWSLMNQTPLSVNIVAWNARNILELLVWVEYCCSSTKHAEEFAMDQGRDAIDALNLPDGFMAQNPSFSFKDHRIRLLHKASAQHVYGLDDPYTRVRDAAAKIGRAEMFRHGNKLLSKFAHPTALSVMTPQSATEALIPNLIAYGEKFAGEALSIIGQFKNREQKCES